MAAVQPNTRMTHDQLSFTAIVPWGVGVMACFELVQHNEWQCCVFKDLFLRWHKSTVYGIISWKQTNFKNLFGYIIILIHVAQITLHSVNKWIASELLIFRCLGNADVCVSILSFFLHFFFLSVLPSFSLSVSLHKNMGKQSTRAACSLSLVSPSLNNSWNLWMGESGAFPISVTPHSQIFTQWHVTLAVHCSPGAIQIHANAMMDVSFVHVEMGKWTMTTNKQHGFPNSTLIPGRQWFRTWLMGQEAYISTSKRTFLHHTHNLFNISY